jgi:AhpD family alkylhydroperoxidase
MEPRIDYRKVAPGVFQAALGLEKYLGQCGIEETLIHLIELRASQINGCAYCIDMHWKDLRAAGETEQRLYGLDAWRESPYYTARERAALAWTEAITIIRETHAPDEVYEEVRNNFSEKEIANLTFAVATINVWNRLAISMRSVPGKYQPAKLRELGKGA